MRGSMLVLAVALGAFAAGLHMTVTYARAAWVVRGRTAAAIATLPLSIGAPVACLGAVVLAEPRSVWVALATFWLLRTWTLPRFARGTARGT